MYKQFIRSLFVEDTLQDALKAQPSLLPRRKAIERLCITSYRMRVHVILSYPTVVLAWVMWGTRFGTNVRLYPRASPIAFPGFSAEGLLIKRFPLW